MGGEILCRTAHYSNEVILPCLNLLLYQVTTVIIWRDKMEGHARLLDFQSVRRGDFVVQYLVIWYYNLILYNF